MPKLHSFLVTTALATAVGLGTPAAASAQRAVVRSGPRAVGVRAGGRFFGGFGFGYPYWYDPWFYPYGYYGYWGPYAYPGYYAYDVASLRLEVTPKQAEVYVDGYRAGIVDNYNGIFQRLHVRPGGHTLTIYLPGYKTFEENIYATPGSTQVVKMTLLPLGPGETMSPPPVPTPPPAEPAPAAGGGTMRVMPPVQVGPGGAPPTEPPPAPPMRPAPPSDASAYGTLTVTVRPSGGMTGTAIFIDGDRWRAPSSSDELLIRLPEGQHHVEVRRFGYVTYTTDVTIQRGASTPLNVKLVRR